VSDPKNILNKIYIQLHMLGSTSGIVKLDCDSK